MNITVKDIGRKVVTMDGSIEIIKAVGVGKFPVVTDAAVYTPQGICSLGSPECDLVGFVEPESLELKPTTVKRTREEIENEIKKLQEELNSLPLKREIIYYIVPKEPEPFGIISQLGIDDYNDKPKEGFIKVKITMEEIRD